MEDDDRIVAGNSAGQLEVRSDSKKSGSRIINSTHSSRIVLIEQCGHNGTEEYVVVDQAGLITIWNHNLNSQLATLNVNASVISAAIREREKGVTENRLVVNCGD